MAEDVFGIVGSVLASTYHVERVVAEGGFGVVYRAQQGDLRAPVALKLFQLPEQNPQQQAAFLQLFRSETEPLVRLSASLPNVVRTLHADAFTSQGGRFVPYLVLEWLDGMTLETLIGQRQRANLPAVTLRKLVRLLTPVARTLERARRFGGPGGTVSIVHGALEPDALFVAQVAGEEMLKILGLGMGKLKSLVSQVAGRVSPDGSTPLSFTPAYGAPEQWAPREYGPTGPWTDVWGLARCMVEVMAAGTVFEGDPATMRAIALDPRCRPTPRTEGIDLPDAIESVFARALALDPPARQAHAGVFWDELVAALDQSEPSAPPRAIDGADELEFDPSSGQRPTAAPARISAPYGIVMSASGRAAPKRAAASGAPFVPDLELAPPPASRRPSGERPLTQPALAKAGVLDLDSAAMPAALDLDLDLPADEPRAQRGVSSQRVLAQQPNAQRPSIPPSGRRSGVSGSMAAVREPQSPPLTRVMMPARSSHPGPPSSIDDSTLAVVRRSRPPLSADVSAPFEARFVAKIEPQVLPERSLARRLRPALVLLGAAILVAVFAQMYAAATGEVLEIGGQGSSLLSGALLVLALGLAVREVIRTQ